MKYFSPADYNRDDYETLLARPKATGCDKIHYTSSPDLNLIQIKIQVEHLLPENSSDSYILLHPGQKNRTRDKTVSFFKKYHKCLFQRKKSSQEICLKICCKKSISHWFPNLISSGLASGQPSTLLLSTFHHFFSIICSFNLKNWHILSQELGHSLLTSIKILFSDTSKHLWFPDLYIGK